MSMSSNRDSVDKIKWLGDVVYRCMPLIAPDSENNPCGAAVALRSIHLRLLRDAIQQIWGCADCSSNTGFTALCFKLRFEVVCCPHMSEMGQLEIFVIPKLQVWLKASAVTPYDNSVG